MRAQILKRELETCGQLPVAILLTELLHQVAQEYLLVGRIQRAFPAQHGSECLFLKLRMREKADNRAFGRGIPAVELYQRVHETKL